MRQRFWFSSVRPPKIRRKQIPPLDFVFEMLPDSEISHFVTKWLKTSELFDSESFEHENQLRNTKERELNDGLLWLDVEPKLDRFSNFGALASHYGAQSCVADGERAPVWENDFNFSPLENRTRFLFRLWMGRRRRSLCGPVNPSGSLQFFF